MATVMRDGSRASRALRGHPVSGPDLTASGRGQAREHSISGGTSGCIAPAPCWGTWPHTRSYQHNNTHGPRGLTSSRGRSAWLAKALPAHKVKPFASFLWEGVNAQG